jgi:preprotein translocase subunit SecE
MIVLALGLLYVTHQGKGFMGLLKDAQVELRRITWPTKQDTFQTTWIVLVIVLIMSLLLWGIDTVFGWLISAIIG